MSLPPNTARLLFAGIVLLLSLPAFSQCAEKLICISKGTTVEKQPTAYYAGLAGRNLAQRDPSAGKVIATRVQPKNTKAGPDGGATDGAQKGVCS